MSDYGFMFDGSGPGSGHYDPKEASKDRKLSASIWIGLTVIFSIFLFLAGLGFAEELYLKTTGHAVTANYGQKGGVAVLYDDSNSAHEIHFDSTFVQSNGNTITLYYKGDDIGSAQPIASPVFWISVIGFFALADAVSIYCTYKNLRVTHYSSKS